MASPGDPFVGRRAELSLLRRRLVDARAGSGHLLVVCGPAGIGKSRLVEEAVAGADGLTIAWGGAIDDAGMPALWPWARALRGLPAARDAVTLAGTGAARRGYGSAEEVAAAAFAGDTAVVDAVADCAAATSGLVVVLEDLQWADRASLRLLERVAAEIRRMPLVVICTVRDGAGGSLPGQLVRHATDVVTVGPLSLGEAAELLTGALESADPRAVARAARLSGGSPLYLRTLSRTAAGPLRGRSPWDESVGEAPELRQLIAAAMRAAGPEAADAIEALSVLGSEAEPDVFAGLIDVHPAGVAVGRLEPGVPAGLVAPLPSTGDAPIRFAHALVRDAVYASLPPARRASLHRRAAELLERLAVARDERAGSVARHWDRAGEPARSVTWAVRAADAAEAAAAYDEAVSYLELAVAAIGKDPAATDGGPAPSVDRAELLVDLARVQYLAGQILASTRSCEQAADEGERSGRVEVVARAAIVVQGIGDPAVNRRIETLCQRALATAGDEIGPGLRARVEAQLACALLWADRLEGAASWSRRALADAATGGDPDAELDAIRSRADLLWQPCLVEEMVELGERAVELAERTRRPLPALWGRGWLVDSAMHRADLASAHREMGALRTLADSTGLPLVRWHLLRREGALAILAGDFGEWRRLATEAAGVAADWHDLSAWGSQFSQSAMVAMLRGDPEDLTPGWRDRLGLAPALPEVARGTFAAALALVGRQDEARAIYESMVHVVVDARGGRAIAAIHPLIELSLIVGDPDECRAVRSLVVDRFGHSPVMGGGTVAYLGSVERVIAELDLASGDAEAAVPHFEAGLRLDGQIGARPLVARGEMGLARALAATGEHRRAATAARTAAAEARRLDMPGLLRAADAFLTDAAARARAEDPLTPREHEVLDLVAQALSNREVAARLVLSERTVEAHVRSILAKTGHTTRAQLIRWALTRQR
jgi:DNA-binding CsgD family transcriptional regulator